MIMRSSNPFPVSQGGGLHIFGGIDFSVFEKFGQSNREYESISIKDLNEEICQVTIMTFLKHIIFFCIVLV